MARKNVNQSLHQHQEADGKTKRRYSRKKLIFATWNVRSLVENSGDACICRSRPQEASQNPSIVDRKLDLLMRELARYSVSVAGIQETKWFGRDVWTAEGYTFLHSGRPLPSDGDQATRNEGVGIALDRKATEAWKAAGEKWEAVSSRIVLARLKLAGCGQRQPGGSRARSSTFVTVISVYAPTAKAPPRVKQQFIEELQSSLDKVSPSDILILLGDFNARVGKRDVASSLWRETLGIHGFDERNDAGEEFLEFCSSNHLTIMNSWFKKKDVYLGTWMHPATKKFHTIDLIVMRAGQRMFCTDVQVMRGANCWTDHKMVRANLSVRPFHSQSRKKVTIPFAVHHLRDQAFRDRYREHLTRQLLDAPHNPDVPAEDSWGILKKCIVNAAESTIGREKRDQPDWFLENAHVITPLIEKKNQVHRKMLQSNSIQHRREFRKHQRIVKMAVHKAKDEWVRNVALEGAEASKDGRTRWKSIRKLQMAHSGRRPTRQTALLKENGELTASPEEVTARWHGHFKRILNIPTEYKEEVIAEIQQLPIQSHLDEPPSEEEIETALSKLKNGKAGGKTGILPEMIKYGGAELWDRVLDLVKVVWEEEAVVRDWKDATIIPIPKKGNLQVCDNWRGISLLDVVGKLFARVIQERLQVIAEEILPESQCGFRKARGCVDMIFVSRQLVEKTIEHDDTLFVLFVDLKKAYDSIPRQALWSVLKKVGVPPKMLNIIQSFHEGMQAEVSVKDMTTDTIEVMNGLRQGCTLAPTLFNVYYSAVVADWRNRCLVAGVDMRFRHGRKLVGDRTAKSRLSTVKIFESQFADDTAIYTTSRDAIVSAMTEITRTARDWGMTVSVEKTKGMAVGCNVTDADVTPLQIENGSVEMVDTFQYLGSCIDASGDMKNEISNRIAKASRAFGSLRKPIFQDKNLSIQTKRAVYCAVVLSVLFYGAETWTLKAEHTRRLRSFHNRCIRTILGVTRYEQWKQRLSSTRLAREFGLQEPIESMLMSHRLRWLGHLGRMGEERMPKQLLFGELEKKRPFSGPRKRWRDMVSTDLRTLDILDNWYELAQDGPQWRRVCKDGIERCQSEDSECAANRQSGSDFSCQCGRTFRRKGDLTRHSRFCAHNNP